MIRNIREQDNPNLAYRILLPCWITETAHTATFTNNFALPLRRAFNTVIEIDTKLRKAQLPACRSRSTNPTRGSAQYRILAQEIMEYVKEKESGNVDWGYVS